MLLFQLTEAGGSMFSRTKVLVVLAMMVALAVTGCGNTVPVLSIALSPSGAQSVAAGQGVNLTATVSNDKLSKGVTWSLSGAGTLSAQTATSVTYTAPSPIPANATATITATSAADTTKLATLTLNLQAVSIVLTPNTAQTLEQSQTVGVTAAVSSDPANKGVTWSITAAGALSGQTATRATFTVQDKDSQNFAGTANLSIKIKPAPVSVTTTSLANGIVNSSYSATLQSTGGATPITWSLTASSLPTGLVLAANGAITGSPTTAGTANFTVQATDSSTPALSATKALSITVIPVLSITTSSLPPTIPRPPHTSTPHSTPPHTPPPP